MTVVTLTVAGFAMLGFALLSRWFTRHLITAPMLMIVVGAVAFGVFDRLEVTNGTIATLAEVTLVLVLFHDASTVRLGSLDRDWRPPVRLLAIGFPLAVLLTFGLTVWLLPVVGVMGALLIAAAISPTDADLGAPTVMNPTVPVRVRRLLNVESGLNDGLATPIVLIALGFLAAGEGDQSPPIIEIAVIPVLLALVFGVGLSYLIARALEYSRTHMESSGVSQAVTVALTPGLIFLLCELFGANAFIAAFLGGLVFGATARVLHAHPKTSRLLETAADLGSWLVWFLAGGLIIAVLRNGISWQAVVIAVAALTVLRLIPVAVSLAGVGFRAPTIAFVGWFGPRGLATVVFALITLEELGPEHPIVDSVVTTMSVVIVFSVFAHGMTAGPLARKYGAWVESTQPTQEVTPASEPAPRGRAFAHQHGQDHSLD